MPKLSCRLSFSLFLFLTRSDSVRFRSTLPRCDKTATEQSAAPLSMATRAKTISLCLSLSLSHMARRHDVMTLSHEMDARSSVTFPWIFYRGIFNFLIFSFFILRFCLILNFILSVIYSITFLNDVLEVTFWLFLLIMLLFSFCSPDFAFTFVLISFYFYLFSLIVPISYLDLLCRKNVCFLPVFLFGEKLSTFMAHIFKTNCLCLGS